MTVPLWQTLPEFTASTEPLTELLVVTDGFVITLTLSGVIWTIDFDAQRQGILDGLTSDKDEAAGWNSLTLAVTTVVRTSDFVVTITVPAQPGYLITENETLRISVPTEAIEGGAQYLLQEDGTPILQEDGTPILLENSITFNQIIETIVNQTATGGGVGDKAESIKIKSRTALIEFFTCPQVIKMNRKR